MTGEVSPLDRDDKAASAELRASHDDRERVAEMLRVAAGDGRLTVEELDQRLEKALTARTYGELAVLTRDLPTVAGAGRTVLEPKKVLRIDRHSGSVQRDGRWLVPQRIEVRVTSGTVTLDFTEAVITQPSLQLDVEVRSGTVALVTKPGIVVDTDDVSVRSGRIKVQEPWGPGTPVILQIQVSGRVGSGRITARPPRPPRRTFRQWLLRSPKPSVTGGLAATRTRRPPGR